jgi:hypothetical protein
MPLPSLGLMEIDISPKPSARRAGEVQCLGDMPGYRATAIKPGANHLMQKPGESQYRPTELTSVFGTFRARWDPVVHWTSLAISLSASTGDVTVR